MTIPLAHRMAISTAAIRAALKQFGCKLRVAVPAIVVDFDEDAQTVSVQVAIREQMLQDAVPTNVTIEVLHDIPIALPTAGGWSLTLPIQAGDECDLVFQDMGIDLWWQNGGIANQPDGVLFRHAIGDAVAWFGLRSQPRKLANYSTTSAQLRSDDASVTIDLADEGITLQAPSVVAMAADGVTQPVMTSDFFTWFTANVMPFLIAHEYAGPPPPSTSVTTIFEAE